MRKNLLVSSVVVCVAAFLGATSAFAAEAWLGTWKLNAAKSKLPSTGMRTTTLTFEATSEGIRLTSEGTDAKGQPAHSTYTSKFDGTDVPWTGNPMADTSCPKRIDDHSYENVWKKDGKPTITSRVNVSKDGKTLTIHQAGTDAQGAAVDTVAVYEKQ